METGSISVLSTEETTEKSYEQLIEERIESLETELQAIKESK